MKTEIEEKYNASNATTCPFCGSYQLEKTANGEVKDAKTHVLCKSCVKEWDENLELESANISGMDEKNANAFKEISTCPHCYSDEIQIVSEEHGVRTTKKIECKKCSMDWELHYRIVSLSQPDQMLFIRSVTSIKKKNSTMDAVEFRNDLIVPADKYDSDSEKYLLEITTYAISEFEVDHLGVTDSTGEFVDVVSSSAEVMYLEDYLKELAANGVAILE